MTKALRAAIILFSCCISSNAKPKRERPHVFFIVGDDIGHNDVGWNNEKVPTTFMNQLARKGVILNNYYTHPLCTPSRAAIQTGYYSDRSGLQRGVLMETQPYGIPLEFKLLPERLKEAGYNTIAIGKWHLGFCSLLYTPTFRGFQSFFGFYNGAEENYRHCYNYYEKNLTDGSCRGFDFRDELRLAYEDTGKYSGGLYSRRMVDIINNYESGDPPLFAYIALTDTHWPLQAPSRFRKKCTKSVNDARRNMCASMVSLDEEVANITEALIDKGLYENSIIIFVSDNGGSTHFGGNNYPLRGEKGGFYEGACRVPAFVNSPLLEKTGYMNNELIHAVDWYPTIMRLAGAKKVHGLDGVDQWNVISKNLKTKRHGIPYSLDVSNNGTLMAAVRDTRYKLIAGSGGNSKNIIPENETIDNSFNYPYIHAYTNPNTISFNLTDRTPKLYDLINDPTESHDIATEKPMVVKRLLRLLKEFRKRTRPAMNVKTDKNGDPENFNNTYSPGWCRPYYATPLYSTENTNQETIQFY